MQTPPFPKHVQIQTTTACGADCTICPHPQQAPRWSNGPMDGELFAAIVEQLRGRSVEHVLPYLMADPLADKKIFERTRHLRAALPAAAIEISTTGKYLVAPIREKLLAAPLTELRISSHGITAEEYARTMPGVDFVKAMANIRAFIAAWQETKPFALRVVSLWGLWSAQRDREIEAFWADLGVELCTWRVTSRSRQVDLTVFNEASCDPTRFREGRRGRPYVCRFQRDTEWLHILSDGRVTLCCMDYGQEQILGDLRTETLAQIWQGPRFAAIRAAVRGDAPADANFLCHRCEWHVSRSVYEQDETAPVGALVGTAR